MTELATQRIARCAIHLHILYLSWHILPLVLNVWLHGVRSIIMEDLGFLKDKTDLLYLKVLHLMVWSDYTISAWFCPKFVVTNKLTAPYAILNSQARHWMWSESYKVTHFAICDLSSATFYNTPTGCCRVAEFCRSHTVWHVYCWHMETPRIFSSPVGCYDDMWQEWYIWWSLVI